MSFSLSPRAARALLGVSAAAVLTALVVATLSPRPSEAREDGAEKNRPRRLLVVTVTKGFRHGDSIPLIESVVKELGERGGGFTVDYVRSDEEMARKMTPDALKQYDGVLFGNTTGDLPLPDRDAFLKWLADGHGFVGVHSATDTFHGYAPYLEMIGAEFKTHGPQSDVVCQVEDRAHPATKMLGGVRMVFDEIYQFKNYDRSKFHGLLRLDKHPNTGEPGDYPIAWHKPHGTGRVFYTALGHRPDVWRTRWYQLHVLGGIRWALGLENPEPTAPSGGSVKTTK